MDTISGIRIKGVVYPIEDETAREAAEVKGLELIGSYETVYDSPYWQEGSDCYFAEITEEQYDLFSKAKIFNIFINPWYDTYYESDRWAGYFVNKREFNASDSSIGDSGDAMYICKQPTDGFAYYYLVATTSAFTKCILPGTQNYGMAAQFYFYG